MTMNVISEKLLPEGVLIRIYTDNGKHIFHAIDDDSGETIERTRCPSPELAQNRFDTYENAAVEPAVSYTKSETAVQEVLQF